MFIRLRTRTRTKKAELLANGYTHVRSCSPIRTHVHTNIICSAATISILYYNNAAL